MDGVLAKKATWSMEMVLLNVALIGIRIRIIVMGVVVIMMETKASVRFGVS